MVGEANDFEMDADECAFEMNNGCIGITTEAGVRRSLAMMSG